jgi:hypothetical protein
MKPSDLLYIEQISKGKESQNGDFEQSGMYSPDLEYPEILETRCW